MNYALYLDPLLQNNIVCYRMWSINNLSDRLARDGAKRIMTGGLDLSFSQSVS